MQIDQHIYNRLKQREKWQDLMLGQKQSKKEYLFSNEYDEILPVSNELQRKIDKLKIRLAPR